MAGLVNVCDPKVKGAHDSDLIVLNGKAYVIYMANDRQPGENPAWDFIYVAMSVVDVESGKIDKIIPMAEAGQAFSNHTLQKGAIFVPRMVIKDQQTLRCYFAVESPGKFEAQTWAIDFDITSLEFSDKIQKAKLKTSAGIEDMQPVAFYKDAVKYGFKGKRKDYGLYPFDIKKFDGHYYSVLNNFPGGQNGVAILHDDLLTFEIMGTTTNRIPWFCPNQLSTACPMAAGWQSAVSQEAQAITLLQRARTAVNGQLRSIAIWLKTEHPQNLSLKHSVASTIWVGRRSRKRAAYSALSST